jgi:alcohol-forming fatty acyl-CoA reductase
MEVGLGISKQDKELLTDKIDVVFHSAATVKFTEPLRFALDMNTMGTRKIVQLCNEMKELKVSATI